MSRSITLEQKYYIKRHSEQGQTSTKIAKDLGLGVSTIRKWRKRIKKGTL